jgi:thiol-disulfide isomerase/thioredoxin
MFNPFKRRWVKILSIGMVLFASSITIALAVLLRDNRPPYVKAFMDLRFEWEQIRLDPANPSKSNEEWAAIKTAYAERSLAIADAHPNTATEIATLQMASRWAPKTDLGQTATERLVQCVAKADLDQLASGITSFGLPGIFVPEVAPLIVERVQEHLDHAVAVTLLSYACSASGSGSEAEVVPPAFAKAAELLVTHFVQSDGLEPFCGALGNGYYSPHWAPQFEPQLRTILRVNQSRWIRCCASLALASLVESNPDRQPEAEKLLEEHLRVYDGNIPGLYQNVESELCRRATVQLEALKHSPLWKPAPEIAGVDLKGNPLSLSEHRGKVVMVSFWATWCGPCMKLISHEREIATRCDR